MKEIRFHGRGGQGIVMGAEMLTYAFVLEGKYASSFPTFGVERRGAPVGGFLRFDEKPIRETHQIYEPDCVVVLDPFIGQSPAIFDGLKDQGIAILNTPRQNIEKWPDGLKTLGLVDATALALAEMGRAVEHDQRALHDGGGQEVLPEVGKRCPLCWFCRRRVCDGCGLSAPVRSR